MIEKHIERIRKGGAFVDQKNFSIAIPTNISITTSMKKSIECLKKNGYLVIYSTITI